MLQLIDRFIKSSTDLSTSSSFDCCRKARQRVSQPDSSEVLWLPGFTEKTQEKN